MSSVTAEWLQWIDGSGADYAYGVATDSMKNVYVTGYSYSTDISLNGTLYSRPYPRSTIAGAFVVKLTQKFPTAIPCFVAGTQILTPNGEVSVESLGSGNLILTADGRSVPINVFTTEIAKTTALNAPYTIPAKTLSPAQKHSITLSPRHAVQIRKDVWEIPEFAKARYPQIKQAATGKPITYYHLQCPNYFTDNIIANGIVAESFGAKQINTNKPLYVFNNKVGGFIRNKSNIKPLAKC